MRTRLQHEQNIVRRINYLFGLQRYWHKSEEWIVGRACLHYNQYMIVQGERKIFICHRALGCQFHDAEVVPFIHP